MRTHSMCTATKKCAICHVIYRFALYYYGIIMWDFERLVGYKKRIIE